MIHVAGTNGKGSTVAFMHAMLGAAGHRVQAYTSPHLVRFNERIRLADGEIGDDTLVDCLDEVERANGDEPITFFEATTCAAFVAFAREKADFVLLETGLGGRLDTTNVVAEPRLTAITPVSIDHQDFLGETLTEIAGEKAGILKPGVPCVTAAQHPDAASVIRAQATALDCALFAQGEGWRATGDGGQVHYTSAARDLVLPMPGLVGPHQVTNAGVALAAMELLGSDGPDAAALAEGLREVRWPGRLQHLTQGPLVDALPGGWELWLDGGHNPAAGAALASTLAQWRADGWRMVLVAGMLATKDAAGLLRPLADQAAALRTVTAPGPAIRAADLAKVAGDVGFSDIGAVDGIGAAGVAAGIADLADDGPRARILICGNLYLAGDVLARNG